MINVIRISAALLVVAGHIRALLFVDWADADHGILATAFYGLTSIGHEAVVVFFLLSGYWVGGAALSQVRNGTFSWRGYLLARIIRLWIVLIPAVVLTAVLDATGRSIFGSIGAYSGDPAYSHVADPNSLDPGTILANLTFLGGIRTSTLGSNGPLWSLSYEFWMYILGPLLLLAAQRNRPAVSRLVYLLLFVGISLVVGSDVLRYLPIWLVGLGISAFQHNFEPIGLRIGSRGLATIRILAALATLLTSVMLHKSLSLAGPVSDYIVAISATLLLVTTSSGMGRLARGVGIVGWYSKMSRFSYSLYAIHLPLLAFAITLFGEVPANRLHLDIFSALLFVGIEVAALLIAWGFAAATESRTSAVRSWAFRSLRIRRGTNNSSITAESGSSELSR